MSEEDLNTYKKYVSDLDITKYIVLDSESNYWYSAEYVDKIFKKQDKEIERLNNIINELERRFNQELENNEKWNIEDTKQFYSKKWYKDTLKDFKNMIKN